MINISKCDAVGIIPNDIILIQNLILTNESLRITESWVPICLPGISDAGYLQLYCNFFEENLGIVFITQYQEHNYFLEFADQSRNIYDTFIKDKICESVKNAINLRDKNINNKLDTIKEDKILEELMNKLKNTTKAQSSTALPIIGDPFDKVLYLVCKHKSSNQMFNFRFNQFDNLTETEIKVIKDYARLYDLYKQNINVKDFFYYVRDDNLLNSVIVNDAYILFASLNFFSEFDEVNELLQEILKLIKSKEYYFFIK
jgi:hypothetical protein